MQVSHKTWVFPQTVFTAVTAYQNQLVFSNSEAMMLIMMMAMTMAIIIGIAISLMVSSDYKAEDRQQPFCQRFPGFLQVESFPIFYTSLSTLV